MSTDGSGPETSTPIAPADDAAPAPAPAPAPAAGLATRRQALWAVIAVAVAAIVFVFRRRRRRGTTTTAGPAGSTNSFRNAVAGPAELDFLAPIAPRSRVGDARVISVGPVRDGAIHLLMSKGGQEFQLAVALADERRPGARFGRYGVYVWEPHPVPLMSGVAEALAQGLHASADREPPAGLTTIQHNP